MTTTASKAGLRATATANRNRHAQRTPLPPKPSSVAAEAIAEWVEDGARRKAADEAAAVAPKPRIRKAQPKVPASAPEPVAAKSDPFTTPAASDSRSMSKAKAVVAALKPHGWSASVAPALGHEASEDVIELTARRGDEVLWISWTGGKMTLDPMPTYTIEDRTVKLKNASAVKQYGARPVEAGAQELSKVRSNRFFRRRPTEPRRGRLPFDPALATDAEVLTALMGQVVSWHNNRTQGTEVAQVGRPGKPARFVKLVEKDGDRILSFVCPLTGFRAFYLGSLVKVGGNPRAFKMQRNGDDD